MTISGDKLRNIPRIVISNIKVAVATVRELYSLLRHDDINNRDFVCTILAATAILMFDIWTYFRYDTREVNWFIVAQPHDTLPTVTWYLKELGTKFTLLALSTMVFILSKMRQWLRVVASCLITYFSIELILFFMCFNRTSSVGTYFLILVIIARAVFLKVFSHQLKRKIFFDSDAEQPRQEIIFPIKKYHKKEHSQT